MELFRLSDDAYNALNKISSKTKMDCWFWLQRRYEQDAIFDLENDKYLDVKEGLSQFAEGIVDPLESYGLTDSEITEVKKLFENFQIVLEGENRI